MKKILFLISFIAVTAIVLTFKHMEPAAFSAFAVSGAKSVIGLWSLYLIAKYGFGEMDTISELKKGNTGYAIHLFSYALIIAAAIWAS